MDLKEIVSVAGVGGLHKIVGHRPNGLILETLDETKKRFPTTLTQKVSILEDIAMFTTDDEVRLEKVLIAANDKEKDGLVVPAKNAPDAELRTFMEAVLPNYDKERVYISDMKKLVNWYSILKTQLDFEALKNKPEETEGEETAEEHKADGTKIENKPAKSGKPLAAKNQQVRVNTNAPMKKTSTPRKTGGGG